MTPRISHDYHPNISIRIPRKSSKLFGGDFAAAMARVTSFNRWAIIEHDLSTSTEVLRPPDEMQRLEESYGVGRGPSFFQGPWGEQRSKNDGAWVVFVGSSGASVPCKMGLLGDKYSRFDLWWVYRSVVFGWSMC